MADQVGDARSFELAKKYMGVERRKIVRIPVKTQVETRLFVEQRDEASHGHMNLYGNKNGKIRQASVIQGQLRGEI